MDNIAQRAKQRLDKRLAREPKATAHQLKYLESLLIDSGNLTSLKVRNAWLSNQCQREITHPDQLTFAECSRAIDRLVREKNERMQDARTWEDLDYDAWGDD